MAQHNHDSGKNGFFASRSNLVLIGFLMIAAFYLMSEHRAHLLGWLPWLFLLACPLLHIFMHSGHGKQDDNENHRDGSSNGERNRPPHQH